jgi:hypothetical protein
MTDAGEYYQSYADPFGKYRADAELFAAAQDYSELFQDKNPEPHIDLVFEWSTAVKDRNRMLWGGIWSPDPNDLEEKPDEKGNRRPKMKPGFYPTRQVVLNALRTVKARIEERRRIYDWLEARGDAPGPRWELIEPVMRFWLPDDSDFKDAVAGEFGDVKYDNPHTTRALHVVGMPDSEGRPGYEANLPLPVWMKPGQGAEIWAELKKIGVEMAREKA